MNYAEKMERENRLKTNLAGWMLRHGEILSDRSRSNEYVGVRMAEVLWRGIKWEITEVDGMVCRIEKTGRGWTVWRCRKDCREMHMKSATAGSGGTAPTV